MIEIKDIKLGVRLLALNPMTLTAAIILLYLGALFLTVATLWPFSYPTQTIFPKKTVPQSVWVLIIVVLPFVMLVYFGLAFMIGDTISDGTAWLTARDEEPSFTEGLVAAVSYIGLSGWLWLRWRDPIAPSMRILGPVTIATLIILIIVYLDRTMNVRFWHKADIRAAPSDVRFWE